MASEEFNLDEAVEKTSEEWHAYGKVFTIERCAQKVVQEKYHIYPYPEKSYGGELVQQIVRKLGQRGGRKTQSIRRKKKKEAQQPFFPAFSQA